MRVAAVAAAMEAAAAAIERQVGASISLQVMSMARASISVWQYGCGGDRSHESCCG